MDNSASCLESASTDAKPDAFSLMARQSLFDQSI